MSAPLVVASDLVRRLLSDRATDATICPSEVARAMVAPPDAGEPAADWRAAMPLVHAAVDRLAADGEIRLSWKGVPMASRAGPYRIAAAQADAQPSDARAQDPSTPLIK